MEKERRQIDLDEPGAPLLLRYLKGEASEEEKCRLGAWMEADAAHEQLLRQTARIYYAHRMHTRIAARDTSTAYEKVCSRLRHRHVVGQLKKISLIAACVAAILGLSTLISSMRDTPSSPAQWITLQANPGTRTHFDLPDGTLVYLNSGSTLSYPSVFDPAERKVNLAGEAYFQVAPDKKHPFKVGVSSDRYIVHVTGTEFNVRAYPEAPSITTTLVSGSVRLEIQQPDGKIHTQTMHPSEKAVYEPDRGTLRCTSVNTLYETAWIEGKLIFKDTPLPEVLHRLSAYYNVNFTLQDTTLSSYSITGILDNRQLSQALDYLKFSSAIDFRIEEVKTDDSRHTSHPRVILWKKNKNKQPMEHKK